MGKNIVIFADGTGQRGGVAIDERRSNVYKIYRAVRCGPDSAVDPRLQLAFYDPGLGTAPVKSAGLLAWLARKMLNTASQATGLGIIGNMVDCYAAIVRLCEPGDRIYLIGFSRGAYTVRCLGGVLGMCGVPTQMQDGSPLRRDVATSRRIAREAVKKVYDYTHSRPLDEASERQRELLDQRKLLAAQFRKRYGSDDAGEANAIPHFIGVFDTVASLMDPASMIIVATMAVGVAAAVAFAASFFAGNFLLWFAGLLVGGSLFTLALLLMTRVKAARGLPGHPWWRTLHLNWLRVQMYDKSLNPRVAYARHAISLDERRRSFPRVKWGEPGVSKQGESPSLEQLWFAGNHSDIGGSYPENESRLSDISLEWMADAAEHAGLILDRSQLRTYPDALGQQHDETRSGIFRWARKCDRDAPQDAPLHPSVYERLAAKGVLQYDLVEPYRPLSLRTHARSSRFTSRTTQRTFDHRQLSRSSDLSSRLARDRLCVISTIQRQLAMAFAIPGAAAAGGQRT